MTTTLDQLKREAVRFRAATEEYVRLHPEDRFTTNYLAPFRGAFPVDCCLATSWMLGHHLRRLGIGEEIRYAWGERGEDTHGWLVVDGMIVDLTADQFEDEDRAVIVLPQGESPWHDTWLQKPSNLFGGSTRHVSYGRSLKVAALMPGP
jgi:hypothetical protein